MEREKARIRWQAKQETTLIETKEKSQDFEENKDSNKQLLGLLVRMERKWSLTEEYELTSVTFTKSIL